MTLWEGLSVMILPIRLTTAGLAGLVNFWLSWRIAGPRGRKDMGWGAFREASRSKRAMSTLVVRLPARLTEGLRVRVFLRPPPLGYRT